MSSRSMAASTELALRLSDSHEYNANRGTDLILVLTGEWLDHNKRHGELTSAELRIKQACWEWFSKLNPSNLERILTVVDQGWINALIQLNAGAEKRKRDGLFLPCISEDLGGFGDGSSGGGGARGGGGGGGFIGGSGGSVNGVGSGWGSNRGSNSSSSSTHAGKSTGANISGGKSRRRSQPQNALEKFKFLSDSSSSSSSSLNGSNFETIVLPEHRGFDQILNMLKREDYPLPLQRDRLIDMITNFQSATTELKANIRIADTKERSDTFTVIPQILNKPDRLWRQLDHASLGAFATTLPLKDQLDKTGPYVQTPWFAATGAYNVGSFIANRVEFAILREFRAWAEGEGRLAKLLKSEEHVPSPLPSWPGSITVRSGSPLTFYSSSLSTSTTTELSSSSSSSLSTPSSSSSSSSSSSFSLQSLTGGGVISESNASSANGKNEKISAARIAPILSSTSVDEPLQTILSPSSSTSVTPAGTRGVRGLENAVSASPSGSIPPGLSLVSKAHLAELWDQLQLKERLELLQGSEADVRRGNTTMNFSSRGVEDLFVDPPPSPSKSAGAGAGAAVVGAGTVSTTSLPITSEMINNVSITKSHQPRNLGGSSSSVGAQRSYSSSTPLVHIANSSTGWGLEVLYNSSSSRGSQNADVSGGTSTVDDFDGDGVGGFGNSSAGGGGGGGGRREGGGGSENNGEDLNVMSAGQVLKTFPYNLATLSGVDVVQRLFYKSLDKVRSPEDDRSREIGFRLTSKWADVQAQNLILSERVHVKSVGGSIHSSSSSSADKKNASSNNHSSGGGGGGGGSGRRARASSQGTPSSSSSSSSSSLVTTPSRGGAVKSSNIVSSSFAAEIVTGTKTPNDIGGNPNTERTEMMQPLSSSSSSSVAISKSQRVNEGSSHNSLTSVQSLSKATVPEVSKGGGGGSSVLDNDFADIAQDWQQQSTKRERQRDREKDKREQRGVNDRAGRDISQTMFSGGGDGARVAGRGSNGRAGAATRLGFSSSSSSTSSITSSNATSGISGISSSGANSTSLVPTTSSTSATIDVVDHAVGGISAGAAAARGPSPTPNVGHASSSSSQQKTQKAAFSYASIAGSGAGSVGSVVGAAQKLTQLTQSSNVAGIAGNAYLTSQVSLPLQKVNVGSVQLTTSTSAGFASGGNENEGESGSGGEIKEQMPIATTSAVDTSAPSLMTRSEAISSTSPSSSYITAKSKSSHSLGSESLSSVENTSSPSTSSSSSNLPTTTATSTPPLHQPVAAGTSTTGSGVIFGTNSNLIARLGIGAPTINVSISGSAHVPASPTTTASSSSSSSSSSSTLMTTHLPQLSAVSQQYGGHTAGVRIGKWSSPVSSSSSSVEAGGLTAATSTASPQTAVSSTLSNLQPSPIRFGLGGASLASSAAVNMSSDMSSSSSSSKSPITGGVATSPYTTKLSSLLAIASSSSSPNASLTFSAPESDHSLVTLADEDKRSRGIASASVIPRAETPVTGSAAITTARTELESSNNAIQKTSPLMQDKHQQTVMSSSGSSTTSSGSGTVLPSGTGTRGVAAAPAVVGSSSHIPTSSVGVGGGGGKQRGGGQKAKSQGGNQRGGYGSSGGGINNGQGQPFFGQHGQLGHHQQQQQIPQSQQQSFLQLQQQQQMLNPSGQYLSLIQQQQLQQQFYQMLTNQFVPPVYGIPQTQSMEPGGYQAVWAQMQEQQRQQQQQLYSISQQQQLQLIQQQQQQQQIQQQQQQQQIQQQQLSQKPILDSSIVSSSSSMDTTTSASALIADDNERGETTAVEDVSRVSSALGSRSASRSASASPPFLSSSNNGGEGDGAFSFDNDSVGIASRTASPLPGVTFIPSSGSLKDASSSTTTSASAATSSSSKYVNSTSAPVFIPVHAVHMASITPTQSSSTTTSSSITNASRGHVPPPPLPPTIERKGSGAGEEESKLQHRQQQQQQQQQRSRRQTPNAKKHSISDEFPSENDNFSSSQTSPQEFSSPASGGGGGGNASISTGAESLTAETRGRSHERDRIEHSPQQAQSNNLQQQQQQQQQLQLQQLQQQQMLQFQVQHHPHNLSPGGVPILNHHQHPPGNIFPPPGMINPTALHQIVPGLVMPQGVGVGIGGPRRGIPFPPVQMGVSMHPASAMAAADLAAFMHLQQQNPQLHRHPFASNPLFPQTLLPGAAGIPVTSATLLQISSFTGLPLWVEYQLHAELLKLQQWCIAHAHFRRMQELRVVWDLAKLAQETVQGTPHGVQVNLFGSFLTGLATPSSDVDVLIKVIPTTSSSGESTPTISNAIADQERNRNFPLLAQHIRGRSWARSVHAIATAHVPVIKVVAEPPPWEPLPHGQPLSPPNLLPNSITGGTGGGGVSAMDASLDASQASTPLSSTLSTATAPVVLSPPMSPTSSYLKSLSIPPISRSPRLTSASSASILQNAPEVEAIALSPGGVHHHKPRRSSAASPQNTASFANLSREPSMGSDLNSLATSHISAAAAGGGGGSSAPLASTSTPSTVVNGGAGGGSNTTSEGGGPPPVHPPSTSSMHRYMRNGWFDPSAPIRLDITFNSASHRGDWTTSFSRKLLVQTPALPPLTLAIKLLLAGHGLNDAFSGGLSSFGVLLTTHVFLQHSIAEAAAVSAMTGGNRDSLPAAASFLVASRDEKSIPSYIARHPSRGMQPGDGRSFYELAEPYALQPTELCGSLAALAASPLPIAMPLLPPEGLSASLPHVILRRGKVPQKQPSQGNPLTSAADSAASAAPATQQRNASIPLVPYPAAQSLRSPLLLLSGSQSTSSAFTTNNVNNNTSALSSSPLSSSSSLGIVETLSSSSSQRSLFAPAGLKMSRGVTNGQQLQVSPVESKDNSSIMGAGADIQLQQEIPLSQGGEQQSPGSSVRSSSPLNGGFGGGGGGGGRSGDRGGVQVSKSSEATVSNSTAPLSTSVDANVGGQTASTPPPPPSPSRKSPFPYPPRSQAGITHSAPTTPWHGGGGGGGGSLDQGTGTSAIPSLSHEEGSKGNSGSTGGGRFAGPKETVPQSSTINESSTSKGTHRSASTPTSSAREELYVEGGIDASLLRSPVLGHYFLRMLKFYSDEFLSPQTTCISVEKGRFIQMGDVGGIGAGGTGGGMAAALAGGFVDPVNIPDPSDAKQNVGRNCFRWYQVQGAYRETRRIISEYAIAHPPDMERLEAAAESINASRVNALSGNVSAIDLTGGAGKVEFPLLGLCIASLKGL